MNNLSDGLQKLVSQLDAIGPALSSANIAQAVEAAQLQLPDVIDYVNVNPRSCNRASVARRDHYELLVMTWLPGQASLPHDHKGSISVMQVVQGNHAIAGNYWLAPYGFVELVSEESVSPGKIITCQDAGITSLRNASPEGETLVTLHVYAPPLGDVRHFIPRPLASANPNLAMPAEEANPVVIIGGGFSGAMTAAQILRRAETAGAPLRVILVERRGAVGEGLAYSTRDPAHVLNVPAGRMSAWPDRPEDFLNWAKTRGSGVLPGDFLPRGWYGGYVRDSLCTAAGNAKGAAKFSIIFDDARRIVRLPNGQWLVHLERGASLRAKTIILAIGHRPPSDPVGSNWSGPRTRFISDPWQPHALDEVRADEPVILLGSGLTAIDAVMSVASRPRSAITTLVSRNGLLPRVHSRTAVPPANLESLAAALMAAPDGIRVSTLLRDMRRKIKELGFEGGDWRSVIDGLRPHTASLWQAMPITERRLFLSRLRPFWEVHRHRLPPPAAERLQSYRDQGQVQLYPGQVISVEAEENALTVTIKPRRGKKLLILPAFWLVNCTGPAPFNKAGASSVMGSLLDQGLIRVDELGLGIETSSAGRVIAADGGEVANMFAVGTLRKPALWESTAVPELRGQAEEVAAHVLDGLSLAQPR